MADFTPLPPRDRAAFANGSEGYAWTTNWCGICAHDMAARTGDPADGCPLILISLEGRTPAEWLDGPRDADGAYSMADQYVCVQYRHEDDGPADPTPIPDPPGQDALIPRADATGVRMLTAYPTPAPS